MNELTKKLRGKDSENLWLLLLPIVIRPQFNGLNFRTETAFRLRRHDLSLELHHEDIGLVLAVVESPSDGMTAAEPQHKFNLTEQSQCPQHLLCVDSDYGFRPQEYE
jgi:hypothetical protein